jgi:hypothetical protein
MPHHVAQENDRSVVNRKARRILRRQVPKQKERTK